MQRCRGPLTGMPRMPPMTCSTVTLPSSDLPLEARSFFKRSCRAATCRQGRFVLNGGAFAMTAARVRGVMPPDNTSPMIAALGTRIHARLHVRMGPHETGCSEVCRTTMYKHDDFRHSDHR